MNFVLYDCLQNTCPQVVLPLDYFRTNYMNKFCQTCGSLVDIQELDNYCYVCDKHIPRSSKQGGNVQEKIYVHQTAEEFLKQESRPTIEEECPKCGCRKAYYTAQQMRSADEGQTVFYECVECGYKYKTNT